MLEFVKDPKAMYYYFKGVEHIEKSWDPNYLKKTTDYTCSLIIGRGWCKNRTQCSQCTFKQKIDTRLKEIDAGLVSYSTVKEEQEMNNTRFSNGIIRPDEWKDNTATKTTTVDQILSTKKGRKPFEVYRISTVDSKNVYIGNFENINRDPIYNELKHYTIKSWDTWTRYVNITIDATKADLSKDFWMLKALSK